MKKYDYLIVGAGLYGAVMAYELGKKGKSCLVIDKRDHIAGNIYCEEIEGLTVVDVVRRAGIAIDMISITGKKEVAGAHGITFAADVLAEEADFDSYDGIVLPGGMPGTRYLGECRPLTELLLQFFREGRKVAAICAAPSVLGGLGILEGKKAACYPGFEDKLKGAEVVFDQVVRDGNVTTSRGMGTAIPFALDLVSQLVSEEKAQELKTGIIYG